MTNLFIIFCGLFPVTGVLDKDSEMYIFSDIVLPFQQYIKLGVLDLFGVWAAKIFDLIFLKILCVDKLHDEEIQFETKQWLG